MAIVPEFGAIITQDNSFNHKTRQREMSFDLYDCEPSQYFPGEWEIDTTMWLARFFSLAEMLDYCTQHNVKVVIQPATREER